MPVGCLETVYLVESRPGLLMAWGCKEPVQYIDIVIREYLVWALRGLINHAYDYVFIGNMNKYKPGDEITYIKKYIYVHVKDSRCSKLCKSVLISRFCGLALLKMISVAFSNWSLITYFHWNVLIDRHLTHCCRDKMATILQTTFWNAFSWMKTSDFRLQFIWILFPII